MTLGYGNSNTPLTEAFTRRYLDHSEQGMHAMCNVCNGSMARESGREAGILSNGTFRPLQWIQTAGNHQHQNGSKTRLDSSQRQVREEVSNIL